MQCCSPTRVDADAVVMVDEQVRPYPTNPVAVRVCDLAIPPPFEGDARPLTLRRLGGRGVPI